METQTMNRSDLIKIRPMIPSDRNFILATWLRALRHGNNLFKLIDSDTYYAYYAEFIKTILDMPSTQVMVACLKEDDEVVLGYSVLKPEAKALHFCYVKASWRSIGIARSLVPIDTQVVTHLTKPGEGILHKHKELIFNPFLI